MLDQYKVFQKLVTNIDKVDQCLVFRINFQLLINGSIVGCDIEGILSTKWVR